MKILVDDIWGILMKCVIRRVFFSYLRYIYVILEWVDEVRGRKIRFKCFIFFLIFCIILNYRRGWYKGVDSMLFFDNF